MKILGLDLGTVKTGVSISDVNSNFAAPLTLIKEKNPEKLLFKVLEVINKNNVKKLVIGLPKNMDGSEGERALFSRKFANTIKNKISDIKIFLQDERGTTITANTYLNITNVRGKKRKKIIDIVSAVIILQEFLDMYNSK
ncbi:MAG: Holliday junction resolvase RuvX [Oscillospiraceae bacterium]|jgi:putative Holliday junction resolvase|nr:Holliday junction resolvase RuvX [Oscillospiraceae bacterium]